MVRRVFLGILAAVLALAAVAIGSGSAWLWSQFGSGEGAMQAIGVIDASTPVVVIDVAAVDATIPFGIAGTTELVVTGSAAPVSVLAGPTEKVDAYVFGAAYDVASEADGAWRTVAVPGSRLLDDPATQEWAERAVGDPAVLGAERIAPGSVVVVSATGAAQSIDLALRYRVPDLGTEVLAGAAIAVFLLLVAITLAWAAVLGLRRRGRHEQ